MAEKSGKKSTSDAQKKIIKGTTSSGLKFQINPELREDTRTLMYLTKMQDNNLEPMEQSKALFKLLDLMFKDGIEDFLNTVAYLHGGFASTEAVISELKEIFDTAKLKN